MSNNSQVPWPELPTAAWRDTCATLQLWTQIVGKIRLTKSPWLNHSWHVTLYVTPRSAIPAMGLASCCSYQNLRVPCREGRRRSTNSRGL